MSGYPVGLTAEERLARLAGADRRHLHAGGQRLIAVGEPTPIERENA
jgi:hypothetical protein